MDHDPGGDTVASDAHHEAFIRNANLHLDRCDNCKQARSGFIMCDHHAELSARSSLCLACGLQVVFEEKQSIPDEPLCASCKADPPQAYADWIGHKKGQQLAAHVIEFARGYDGPPGLLKLVAEAEAAFPMVLESIEAKVTP